MTTYALRHILGGPWPNEFQIDWLCDADAHSDCGPDCIRYDWLIVPIPMVPPLLSKDIQAMLDYCAQLQQQIARISPLREEITPVTPDQRTTLELAFGRILRLGSRPYQTGDIEQYERCREIIMDVLGDQPAEYRPDWARDRLRGAPGDA